MNIGDLRVSGIKWFVCIWRMPLLSVSLQRKKHLPEMQYVQSIGLFL